LRPAVARELRIAPLLSGQLGSSTILRGVYVRKRVMCDELPSPDFTIVNSRVEEFEAEDRTMLSTREAVTEIASEGACPACHVQINPLGLRTRAIRAARHAAWRGDRLRRERSGAGAPSDRPRRRRRQPGARGAIDARDMSPIITDEPSIKDRFSLILRLGNDEPLHR
jgi:hypothetical protein